VDYAARAVVEQGQSLSGRRVMLTGMVVTGANDRPYLGELVVDCCAADARPVLVGLTGAVPNNLVPGAWIEVEGGYTDRIERDPHSGDLIPYLEVSSVRAVP
jgi:putative membrane protein